MPSIKHFGKDVIKVISSVGNVSIISIASMKRITEIVHPATIPTFTLDHCVVNLLVENPMQNQL